LLSDYVTLKLIFAGVLLAIVVVLVIVRSPVIVSPVFLTYAVSVEFFKSLIAVSVYCLVVACKLSVGSPARVSKPLNVPPVKGKNPNSPTSSKLYPVLLIAIKVNKSPTSQK
jgi:hypothetical protein